MQIKNTVMSLSVVLAYSFTLPAYADIRFEFKGGERQEISGNYFKSTQEDGNLISIVNFKEKVMRMPNKHDKTYVEMSYHEMCNMGGAVADTVSNALEKLPEEQREMMASLLAQSQTKEKSKYDIEIINIGASQPISGYKTTKYKVVVDGEIKEILWLTTDKKVMHELQHLLALKDELSCQDDNDYQDSEAYQALSEKGYPLKTYLNSAAFDEGNNNFSQDLNYYEQEDVEEVIAIDYSDISPEEFLVPQDYKKTTWAEQMQKMMMRSQEQVTQ